MKKLLLFCLLLCGIQQLEAQEKEPLPVGYHQHDGFYLSMSGGSAFGSVKDHLMDSFNNPYDKDYSGMGALVDVKIGWALKKSLILHATFISNIMDNPNSENLHPGYQEYSKPTKIKDALFGAGFTYYLLPSNFLFSWSMGLGKFSVTDDMKTHEDIASKAGMAMQFKLGKEWWVSKDWALGIGLTYNKIGVTSDPYREQSNQLNSMYFGIALNATFN